MFRRPPPERNEPRDRCLPCPRSRGWRDVGDAPGEDPGTAGNQLAVSVRKPTGTEEGAFVEDETLAGALIVQLARKPLTKVTRVRVKVAATGQTKELLVKDVAEAGAVKPDLTAGTVAFFAGEAPAAADKVIVSYVVAPASSRLVTVRYKTNTEEQQETFVVADSAPQGAGGRLRAGEGRGGRRRRSQGARADTGRRRPAGVQALRGRHESPREQRCCGRRGGGQEGPRAPAQRARAHRGGRGFSVSKIADELKARCDAASTDKMKADRIAVVGTDPKMSFDAVRSHTVDSDRVILVAPGLKLADAAPGAAGRRSRCRECHGARWWPAS